MLNNLIYVFCISASPLDASCNIEQEGLKSLVFDNFHVIIKYVSESEFSEENFKQNVSNIQWLETNAREHIRVINSISVCNNVIPFKFGTIFQAEVSLKKFVTDYSDSLLENFKSIDGKEEWSVKIFCDRKALCEQIDELSPEAAALEKQIMASSPGKAFLLKRKKIDLVQNEIDRLCKSYGQDYYDEFHNLSESTHLNNLLPKEYTGREDTMILNATFLVNKEKVADFIATVDKLSTNVGNTGFFIDASGPWPPFSFISIKEKRNA